MDNPAEGHTQAHNEQGVDHQPCRGNDLNNNSPFKGLSELFMRKELLVSRLVKFDDKPESLLARKATFRSVGLP